MLHKCMTLQFLLQLNLTCLFIFMQHSSMKTKTMRFPSQMHSSTSTLCKVSRYLISSAYSYLYTVLACITKSVIRNFCSMQSGEYHVYSWGV